MVASTWETASSVMASDIAEEEVNLEDSVMCEEDWLLLLTREDDVTSCRCC